LASVFSVNLLRSELSGEQISAPIRFKASLKDICYLFLILITCIFLDIALFRLDGQLLKAIDSHSFYSWVHAIVFQLRIYLPIILFSLTIQIRIAQTEFDVTKIIFLLVTLWLCNEVAYEFVLAVRSYVFTLLLSPVEDNTAYYILESVFGVGLIASLFIGYYCAMTVPFKIDEQNQASG
jgi:hypothetical protein